jgi:branched-chain amino acid transport system ATP-binding protein
MVELLKIDAITAGYGGRPVLREISLAINQGEVVAVIGPNGHGKTTLLRATSGLLPVISGNITFAGESLIRLRADRIVGRGLAHIPQGDLIFPEMTVLENLIMGGYLAPRAETAKRLNEVFGIFPKLAERRTQKAMSLSGGERRMLGLGRGLMTGGRLIMIDEPSLGLAPAIIDQIYTTIAALKRQGRTLLIVEEDVSRVLELADCVYLLDHGEFIWAGTPRKLQESPDLVRTYFG